MRYLGEVDREALAWAAGFFDGEGSTVQSTDARNGSVSVRLSVPQGGDEAAAILERFSRAVGGAGTVLKAMKDRPDRKSMLALQVQSFEGVQAVVAMLWPWLSETKKAQATRVLLAYREYWYAPGHRRTRLKNNKRCRQGHALTADNTYLDAKGRSRCKTCRRAYDHKRRPSKLGVAA